MQSFKLGEFEVRPAERVVLHLGEPVALGARAFDLLLAFMTHPDRLLSKDELLAMVWPGVVVEENNLTVQVSALRKLLGSEALATVSGRGYQLTLPVVSLPLTDTPPLAKPDRPWIVVLPFTNMDGSNERDYFADGMVEDITTTLARTELFYVIARNTAFTYAGKSVDVKQLGHVLGVQYVLEGSVRRNSGKIRINCQLINVMTGAHLWAERFDGGLGAVFDLQDRITHQVIGAIQAPLQRSEIGRALVKTTQNLDAYDLMWRAYPALYGANKAQRTQALGWIEQALTLDPHFSYARAAGAFLCMHRLHAGDGNVNVVMTGLRLAEQALAEHQDNPTTLAWAGVVLGMLGIRLVGLQVIGFRYDEALYAMERAQRICPDVYAVAVGAGTLRTAVGDAQLAHPHFDHAMRLSPLDPAGSLLLAVKTSAYLAQTQYDLALATAQRAVHENPTYSVAQRALVLALAALGRMDESKTAAQRLMQLSPDLTVSRYRMAVPIRDPVYRKQCGAWLRAAGVPR